MPREFNGTTDRIDYGSALTTSGVAVSFAAWIYPDGVTPGATSRHLLASLVSGGSNGTTFNQASGLTGALNFTRVRATTNRTVNSAASVLSAGAWQHVVITDTGTLSTGQTAFYINGAAIGLGVDTAGSGTETTADQGFSVGGRIIDDARMYDGQLAHVAVYDRVLTAAEVSALYKGCPPTAISGLRFYARLAGDDYKNLYDGSGTLDGTTVTQATQAFVYRPRLARLGKGTGVVTPTPAITLVSDTNTIINGTGVTITGTDLGSATAVTLKQTGAADQNLFSLVTANTSTSITLSAVDVQATTIGYGAATLTVTTAGGESTPYAVTVSPESGIQYVTLSGHVSGDGWAADLASADGDQLTAPTTFTGSTVTLLADGSISFTPALPNGSLVPRQWYDASTDTWTEDVVTVNGGSGGGGNRAPMAFIRKLRQRRAA